MPSKKKKKKKKKSLKPQEVEFDFKFTDVTMLEAEEEYTRVKELVEKNYSQPSWTARFSPHFSKISDFAYNEDWNINTILTITSPFGIGKFELNLRADGSVYIIDYECSGNPATSPDLSALLRWSQIKGWKIPQPTELLVKANTQFWRYMWETLIIDSPYLDEKYGIRKSLDMREAPKTEMELAEEEELEGLGDKVSAERRQEWKKSLNLQDQNPKATE
jgi:hypothetical protein